ncbi:metallophosphoesterase family protein [Paenibacillus gorillae]|uniref:metallophosphoesterase family protein n=1 Tax=Paenibacillus gorillae TaxID=1243662 RepID=UPI0004BB0FFA|nr:DNA repair exonuclease [Paenibacillus gorillae]
MSAPFRFIHAADLHLDSPFRGMSKAPEALRAQLMASTFGALRALTETAVREQVDFIVLSGDLYDSADRSLKAQLLLVKEWERLQEHGIAVFVIHGNHDPINGSRAELQLPASVTVFGADRMEYRPAYCRSGELAAFVYGMSYGTRHVTDNLAAAYETEPGAPFHIAMLHGNVNGDASHDPYAPCSLDELVGGKGFDYWALGHIHTRQVLHQYPHVVYPGNIQGRNPREAGERGCYIVDVSASRAVTLTFTPLDELRWLEAELPIAGIVSEQELLGKLDELADRLALSGEGRSVMLRLKLTGRGPLHAKLTDALVRRTLLEQLQETRTESVHEVWSWIYALEANTSSELQLEGLADEDSFAGELSRVTAALLADKGEWRTFAREAIEPLAAHAKLSRLLRGSLEELPARWLEQARELTLGLMDGEGRKDG